MVFAFFILSKESEPWAVRLSIWPRWLPVERIAILNSAFTPGILVTYTYLFTECALSSIPLFDAIPIAAGALIVREAGGICIDTEGLLHFSPPIILLIISHRVILYSGGPLDLMSRRMICASSDQLARQIIPLLHQMKLERDWSPSHSSQLFLLLMLTFTVTPVHYNL